ncbi:hypothetical protein NLA06_03130 [Desulfomicrobium sp. ZS1]|uniref:hypothetical protein n=1 Tax=Desulfomicrobium sp. ZS1 TaxID=2952228 RepID=UPI0020B3D17D|nr:hypothetical protein [Desulfomicrobium sp. ZS1]UTF50903.1 hypothetical protein NLA06_03130 [Desulfomicrobium sp. ZS1]
MAHWEKLLGYEPAIGSLLRDTGDPNLTLVQMVVEDEEQDKDAILWALRKTFENGHSLPADLGIAVCDLLAFKKPAKRVPKTERQKLQERSMNESYAEWLGVLRVDETIDGQSTRPVDAAARKFCSQSTVIMQKDSDTFIKFCWKYRKAILCGEFREIYRRLSDNELTIDSEGYRRWVQSIHPRCVKLAKPCLDWIELRFK